MKLDKLQILNRCPFANKKLISIVGNGGISPEDDKIIYESDCVIRFNNFATRQGITKTKDPNTCDVLFSTFDLHSEHARPKHVVIGIPFPFHSSRIADKSTKWYQGSQWWMVNPYWNEIMCHELKCESQGMGYQHPFPSIGFTCLWHMNRLGIFESTRVHICGFNFYFDWDTKLFQGYEAGLSKYPRHHNHTYPIEIRWIIDNLSIKNLISFSDEIIKIFEIAKNQIRKNAK